MLRSEVIELIQGRLGNRKGLDQMIISEMGLAQTQFEMMPELPWFLLKRDESLTTAINDFLTPLPVDFIREWEEQALFYQNEEGTRYIEVPKEDHQRLNKAYGSVDGQEKANPKFYSVINQDLWIYPKTNFAWPLRLFYYGKAEVLTGQEDIENVWLEEVPLLMVGYVGMQIARHLRDPEGVTLFNADYQQANDYLMRQNEARKQAAMAVFMGG